ncbi:histidine kinase [Halorubrum sp. 48-1-W]|uniref:DICT sensory domain-containing protein n=1 Tax=Halorubrum sp. 48-1-W TaxID=2249761 RepID=UPI000DCD71F4|nr:DICT sensory domain-containing protein [Halorubrum sp. 48-1-W]RAW44483.1 histidine kinase [Halorubrum sp. 48-1-W]
MTVFDDLFAETVDRGRRLIVYRTEDGDGSDGLFVTRNVAVDRRTIPVGGPEPFVEIREDEKFVGVLGLDVVEELTDPSAVPRTGREDVSPGHRVLLETLDDTVFASMDRRHLLAVSREIEDRAYRVGRGTLRVAFQTPATFDPQADVYRRLAGETDLDIHLYGVGTRIEQAIEGVTSHPLTDDRYWVLAFEDGDDGEQNCALVARERSDGYRGFWTNDPDTVRDVSVRLADG